MSEDFSELGLIVVAAGSSGRFGKTNKLLQDLAGLPLFCHCLQNFLSYALPQACLLLVLEEKISEFRSLLAEYLPSFAGFIKVLPGGSCRSETVWLGLQNLPVTCEFVAIQDAARPLSSAKLLANCLRSARQYGSGVAARRMNDTIKLVNGEKIALKTLERSKLWASETPQVFRRELLQQAFAKSIPEKNLYTDDAQLLEEAGIAVKLVENQELNLKITYPKDLVIAEFQITNNPLQKE